MRRAPGNPPPSAARAAAGEPAPAPEPLLDLGTAGASARREHDRRHANRERRTREKHPHIGGFLLAVQDDPTHELVWARGAKGEEVVARELAKHCGPTVLILHDRRIPRSHANIDHIAVAPSGVWVIDSKRYAGKVSVTTPLFGQSKFVIKGHDQSKLADGLAKQVALVEAATANCGVAGDEARGVPVRGALCFVDADLPLLGKLSFRGFRLLYPKALAKIMNADGPMSAEQVRAVATALAVQFPSA
jgi:Nuclease-related domain